MIVLLYLTLKHVQQERKERLKKEGKLVSKAEKERRLRTELQLQALEQQGAYITVLLLLTIIVYRYSYSSENRFSRR